MNTKVNKDDLCAIGAGIIKSYAISIGSNLLVASYNKVERKKFKKVVDIHRGLKRNSF